MLVSTIIAWANLLKQAKDIGTEVYDVVHAAVPAEVTDASLNVILAATEVKMAKDAADARAHIK